MKNLGNIIPGPICIITSLVVLTLSILELKDKIQAKRMKKEHAAAQNDSNEQQV